MAIVNRTTAKTYFNTGDKPTESQFGDFIDSALFYEDTSNFGRSLVSASTATSVRSLLEAGTVGNNLFTAITTASAQQNIGGGIVGRQVFEAITTASGRSVLDAQPLNNNLTAFAGLSGSADKIPYFTGSGTMALQDRLATTTNQGVAYLNNPITIANNASTPNTDIDFSGGKFDFSDGSGQAIASALTKRLQSSGAWSAGAAGNLLLTGARANSSTYHLYAISKTDGTTDYGALLGVANTDPNPTSVLPSGYTKFERVGSVLTDASGNIRAFTQNGKFFSLTTPLISQNLTLSTNTRSAYAVDVPLGIKTLANIYGSVNKNVGGSSSTYVSDLATTDIDPVSLSGFYTMVCNISYNSNTEISRITNKSTQIGIRCNNSASSTNVIIMTFGWQDINLKY